MGLVFQVVDPGLNQSGVSSGDTHGQHLVGKDFGGDGLSFSSGAVGFKKIEQFCNSWSAEVFEFHDQGLVVGLIVGVVAFSPFHHHRFGGGLCVWVGGGQILWGGHLFCVEVFFGWTVCSVLALYFGTVAEEDVTAVVTLF